MAGILGDQSKKVPRSILKDLMPFWVLFLPLVAAIVVSAISLPRGWAAFSVALLTIVGAGIFLAARWSYKEKIKIEVERGELRGIVLNLEDGVILYDKDFKILFFNPAAENIFSLKADQVLDHKIKPQDAERPEFEQLVQVVYPSLAPTVVSRSREGVYPQVVDLTFEEPELELRVVTAPLADEWGGVFGFLKIIQDRTREQYLLRSKNEFVTVASHQLRGPITNINWALEVLSKDESLSEGSKVLVDNAILGGQQLLRIIEDLINIAKIEEGRFGYNFESTDLIQFINDILTNVLPQARRAGIKVYFDRPKEKLPNVFINQEKMTMVFYNFLDNAIRYNVENGEVTVKLEKVPDEPFLVVSVRDTGIGIPAGEINKIFSKFFRAENAVKFQTEGSGLGLYINKNIIIAHGGKIWAESEVNRGTTFHFTLPTTTEAIPEREMPMME